MKFILVLYFMGTHAVFDLPDREACSKAASKLTRELRGDQRGNYGYEYQCWTQTPLIIDLAQRMVSR